VLPGITGWAQVNGRNSITWKDKFELDLWYVQYFSFKLDLRILSMTLRKAWMRDGVNAQGEATVREFIGNPVD
jgi:lipopolysaccharide/colanic/teichoic acid biosynthesis glycosyltransferase